MGLPFSQEQTETTTMDNIHHYHHHQPTHPQHHHHPQATRQMPDQAEIDHDQEAADPDSSGEFLQRVGKLPLFSGVVRAYERGKGTSKVVRYGADLVESSVTSLSGRVASKVGPERIAQIDRYAGAALDRLGQFSHPQQAPPSSHPPACPHCLHPAAHAGLQAPSDSQQPFLRPLLPPPAHRHAHSYSHQPPINSSLPAVSSLPHYYSSHHHADNNDDSDVGSELPTPAASPGGRLVQLTPRTSLSRWQNMLVEAGVTAGGIGAAVSEESMKSLQYCLQWLHYATVHLDHQITVLRDFIHSLNVGASPESYGRSDARRESESELETEAEGLEKRMVTAAAAGRLAGIKTEVVETIRKVVAVVSRYAGVGLPEPAKQFVRTTILGLPLRWADAIQPSLSAPSAHPPLGRHSKNATLLAAGRVLTFAVESLDMLKALTAIFSESVERADAWVERLRVIGIQHRNQQAKHERAGRLGDGRAGEGQVVGAAGPESVPTGAGGVVRSRASSASTMNESLSDSLLSASSVPGSLNTPPRSARPPPCPPPTAPPPNAARPTPPVRRYPLPPPSSLSSTTRSEPPPRRRARSINSSSTRTRSPPSTSSIAGLMSRLPLPTSARPRPLPASPPSPPPSIKQPPHPPTITTKIPRLHPLPLGSPLDPSPPLFPSFPSVLAAMPPTDTYYPYPVPTQTVTSQAARPLCTSSYIG
ncbi:hypothetical protein PTTG_25673 [Puccinia triticina 1-1 BBBD Race 1]|uniref:Opi1-domain-containing protein n=1 Tax=Puccinia triticina (isolate 1-1 / race 1 (BBBD)) TaxID=630390 RepID=A0A180H1X0_PUCT1|nr:hypothetical protein PTTG_25673 [Puccinia triticina 1-1 BBBD Race 1]